MQTPEPVVRALRSLILAQKYFILRVKKRKTWAEGIAAIKDAEEKLILAKKGVRF